MGDDFDQKVAALRGRVPAKQSKKRKSDCTPEDWAAHMDYRLDYTRANSEKNRENAKRWARENADLNRARAKLWRESNKDRHREKNRSWRKSNADKARAYGRLWAQRNVAAAMAYRRARLRSDPSFRLVYNLRQRLRCAIKGGSKKGSAVRDLGCTIAELWAHLESQFQPGMTRENWGTAWEVDHIFPLAKTNLQDRTEFLAANNWRNLQPLTPPQNAAKKDRITPEAQVLFDRLCAEFREQAAA